MDYFVGENIFALNSGTEFSQFDRLKAFNKKQKQAILLTRNYNVLAFQAIKDHKIDPKSVINMYDFFQGTTDVKRKKQPLRLLGSIPLTDYHVVGIDNNKSEITYNGKRIGLIHVMPATVGLIGSIEYYDSLGQTAVREYWDWRGFKSMVETYHPDGSIAAQKYLHLDGTTALEVTHMYINKVVRPTMWKLINYKGRDRQFKSENELFAFFLDEVTKDNLGNIISDRRSLDEAVLLSKNSNKKFAYLHSVPFNHWDKPSDGILPAYQGVLQGINGRKFDKVIVPTQQEASFIENSVTDAPKLVVADDSYVDKVGEAKKLGKDITLAYVGRLSEEKNIIDLIKAFEAVHQEMPNTKLKLQGYYSNKNYQEKIETTIKDAKLTNNVEILKYNPFKTIDEEADLFLNTSDSEGFGMNMLKSMGYGTPVVSYGIPYTENDLIVTGINGYSVDKRTPKTLAHRVLKILKDENLYEKLSHGALQTAKEHNLDSFIQSWSQAL